MKRIGSQQLFQVSSNVRTVGGTCLYVRMYVCMFVCMYGCMYVYMYCRPMCICNVRMYARTYVYTSKCACVYVCTNACMHECIYVCIMCVCMYIKLLLGVHCGPVPVPSPVTGGGLVARCRYRRREK